MRAHQVVIVFPAVWALTGTSTTSPRYLGGNGWAAGCGGQNPKTSAIKVDLGLLGSSARRATVSGLLQVTWDNPGTCELHRPLGTKGGSGTGGVATTTRVGAAMSGVPG